jgi:hypothetical protein
MEEDDIDCKEIDSSECPSKRRRAVLNYEPATDGFADKTGSNAMQLDPNLPIYHIPPLEQLRYQTSVASHGPVGSEIPSISPRDRAIYEVPEGMFRHQLNDRSQLLSQISEHLIGNRSIPANTNQISEQFIATRTIPATANLPYHLGYHATAEAIHSGCCCTTSIDGRTPKTMRQKLRELRSKG